MCVYRDGACVCVLYGCLAWSVASSFGTLAVEKIVYSEYVYGCAGGEQHPKGEEKGRKGGDGNDGERWRIGMVERLVMWSMPIHSDRVPTGSICPSVPWTLRTSSR